jgi:hypothetical protein
MLTAIKEENGVLIFERLNKLLGQKWLSRMLWNETKRVARYWKQIRLSWWRQSLKILDGFLGIFKVSILLVLNQRCV